MTYAKPPLTFDQQADLLIGRGMAGDRALIISRLQSVSYYRLSGYWFPFRNPDPADAACRLDTFRAGATFDAVWDRYVFDRRLRLLVMDAVERVEVAVRSQLAYHHAHHHGSPFAYADDPKALPGLRPDQRQRFFDDMAGQLRNSKEMFVEHFRAKYGKHHAYLPVWMAAEVMTFGSMLTFYRGCHPDVRKAVTALLGVHDTVLDSWLLTLNTIRNICAHHGRLWNRELGVRPKIPHKDPDWHSPVKVESSRMFAVLTICRYSLSRIAPQSLWPDRLRDLLTAFPRVPLLSMGFPLDWENCPIWQSSAKSVP